MLCTERSPDDHFVNQTKLCQQLSVFVYLSENMATQNGLIAQIVWSDLRFEVAQVDLDIFLWNLIQ